jgi:hypothetical protein
MTTAAPATARALAAALPAGTTRLAAALAAVADRRLRALTGHRGLHVGPAEIDELLVLPRLLDEGWPEPSGPVPVPGGAVHADLVDDDVGVFDALRAAMPDAGPEALADAAQRWRLPVTPYRWPGTAPFVQQPGLGPDGDPPAGGRRGEGLRGVRVVDLTGLWAGPLCTALLARAGAQVTKVDPSCRPDGFRDRPALYHRLNGSKDVVDLDLRRPADRERFEALVRRADLVVHSFSRRVMPNLGYGPGELRALNPDVATLAISAFPAGCREEAWLAYGSGVHAASGLGLVAGQPMPATVAYPDPLAGLAAFAVALSLVGRTPGAPASAEVSLAGVVAPLVPAPVAAARR